MSPRKTRVLCILLGCIILIPFIVGALVQFEEPNWITVPLVLALLPVAWITAIVGFCFVAEEMK